MRNKKKVIMIGEKEIGGDKPVLIQSMCNTPTSDVNSTVSQILELEKIGCEIIRISIPDTDSANAIKKIKKNINIPLVADIHFDYRLAILAIKNGIDKLRINPGNIGSEEKVRELCKHAKDNGIPIRIGVNSGSIDKKILSKYKKPCAEAMYESVLEYVGLLEKFGFYNIVLSLKSSSPSMTVEANRLISKTLDYPIHLGVTECGSGTQGTVKASVGIAPLLLDGIGDTIRVSVTGNPIHEIPIAKEILSACGLRRFGVNIIACPTCARCQVDLEKIVDEVKKATFHLKKHIDIAVMGCQVNGPGEAKGCDIGIAGAPKDAVLFVKGKIKSRHSYESIKDALLEEIINFSEEK